MLILAACGNNSTNHNAAPTVTVAPSASAIVLRSTASAATPSAGNSPAAGGASTVQLRPRAGGTPLLANQDGKTLYVFDRDTPGTSACTDACAGTWPPLVLTTGAPVAPTGLTGTLSLVKRPDGAQQVALNGRPLYTYAADSQPGDAKGDGVGGVWHLAGAAPATPTPASSSSGYPGY